MKIKQLPSGNYTTHIYVGTDSSGKKRFKRFTAATKARVKQMANEYLSTHLNVVDTRSLDECINSYLQDREAVLSPSTYNNYLSIYKNLKAQYPRLIQQSIDKITAIDMQQFVSSAVNNGCSRKYILNILGLIRPSMRAQGCELPDVTLPEKEIKEIRFPSSDYVSKLLSLAKGKRIEIALRLSTYGLRRGEVCGLHKSDLSKKEQNKNTIYILHVQRSMVQNTDKQWIERIPKTPESNRYIPIDPYLADLIMQSDNDDGRATDYTPRTYSAAYLRFINANKLEYYHIHSFRHFFCSYLHSQGYTDAQIMKLGGWSTPHVMNQIYRHSMDTPDISNLIGDL